MAKSAPVQGEYDLKIPSGEVPWEIHLLACSEYNRHHDQTPERLAERSGLAWSELIACLRGDCSHEGVRKVRDELRQLRANGREG